MSVTDAATDLTAALARRQKLELRGGLTAAEAEQVARAVVTGSPLPASLDSRIRAALGTCRVTDLPAAILGLSNVTGRLERAASALRGATIYPFATLGCVAVAGVSIAMATAALDQSGLHPSLPSWGLPAAAAAGLGCGVVLLLLMLGRVRLGGLRRGWDLAERAAWFGAARVLLDSGADAVSALRGATEFLPAELRRSGTAIATALESGRPPAPGPLLPSHTSTLLFSAARRGALSPTLHAFDDHQRLLLRRVLPYEASRVQTVALLLVGGSLAAVAIAFYWSYLSAVVN